MVMKLPRIWYFWSIFLHFCPKGILKEKLHVRFYKSVSLSKIFSRKIPATRILTKTRTFDQFTPVLRSLLWLPVGRHVNQVQNSMPYLCKCLNDMAPTYLADIIGPSQLSQPLRSYN